MAKIPLIRCFGYPDDKVRDIGVRKLVPPTHGPGGRWEVKPSVTVFNPKMDRWEAHGLVDYVTQCPGPGCAKLIRVQAVAGTTWFAACSKECSVAWVRAHPGAFTDGGTELIAKLEGAS